MQAPPSFSALHVNGKRASDLAREGKNVELPPRPVTVFEAKLTETKTDSQGLIEYCKISFSVSKGTYIRSLSRDIAKACGSCGHLIGLYRTKVGDFRIEEAAGYSLLPAFTIEGCRKAVEDWEASVNNEAKKEQDVLIQKEILTTMKAFDEPTAVLCGFVPVHLKDDESEECFRNGKPVLKKWFTGHLDDVTDTENALFAVFSQSKAFCGLIEKKDSKHFSYRFVIAFSR